MLPLPWLSRNLPLNSPLLIICYSAAVGHLSRNLGELLARCGSYALASTIVFDLKLIKNPRMSMSTAVEIFTVVRGAISARFSNRAVSTGFVL